MKISELLHRLQAIKDAEGDIDVNFVDHGTSMEIRARDVRVQAIDPFGNMYDLAEAPEDSVRSAVLISAY